MKDTNRNIENNLHDLTANGAIIRLTDNTLTLVYEENIFSSRVLRRHRFGKVEYGLFQRDHIPVILIGFSDIQYDFWVNAYDLLPAIYRDRLNDYTGRVCFTLVAPKTRQVIINRTLYFNEHLINHLKSCLQEQWAAYHHESEVRERIREATEFASTEAMFNMIKRYVCPGKTRHRYVAKK